MLHHALVFVSVGWLGLAACSCSSSSSANPDGFDPTVDAGKDASPNGALQIASLSSTVDTVTGGTPAPTESNTVTFIAIATDTAGLDTIAGGQLVDDAGASYAAFGAGANKGTYTASVTFAQINQAKPVTFAASGGTRAFSAKFFDNAGNVATATLTIKLSCRAVEGLSGACAGVCANVASDALNCGACGKTCAVGQVCQGGVCGPATVTAGLTACTDFRAVISESTCAEICTTAGKTAPQYALNTYSALACAAGSSSGGVASSALSVSNYLGVGGSFTCDCT